MLGVERCQGRCHLRVGGHPQEEAFRAKGIGSHVYILITDYVSSRVLARHWGFYCSRALSPLPGSAEYGTWGHRGEQESGEARPMNGTPEAVGLSL